MHCEERVMCKGYLNIIFFDEQFNYVNSFFKRVSESCDGSDPLVLMNNEAQKMAGAIFTLATKVMSRFTLITSRLRTNGEE